jgi:putative lipoic acid-binding regulatory protein
MASIDYPTRYTFKVMGRQADDFSAHVRALFARVLSTALEEGSIEQQPSRQGTYVSVSVTVVLSSEDQRRDIYAQLHADPRIVYYL